MSSIVTPESEAAFIKTMIERDLNNNRWTNDQRLDYLKDVGNHVDDLGENILRADKLGEGPIEIGDTVKTTIHEELMGGSLKHDDMIGPGSHSIGEDRDEFDLNDLDVDDIASALRKAMPGATVIDMSDPSGRMEYIPPRIKLFDELFDAIKPPDYKGMNLIEFIRSGECLFGDEAKVWLYKNKIPHECDHIHVYPYEMVMFLPDEDQGTEKKVSWITPAGARREDDMITAIRMMFSEYVDKEIQDG